MFNIGGWTFWIIIGVSVVSWIFGKLREQAEMNRAKQEREKQRVDNLRTGQGLNTGSQTIGRSTPTISQRDLQARRQAQLKALRDRQRALGQTGATSTYSQQSPQPVPHPLAHTPTPTPPAPLPSAPLSRQASRLATIAAQRAARAKQIRINRQRQLQQKLQQQFRPQPRTQPQQSKPPSSFLSRLSAPKKSHIEAPKQSRIGAPKESRIGAPKKSRISQRASLEPNEVHAKPAPRPPSRTSQLSGSLAPTTRDDWRRAIIASELLAPPVSMREID